MSRIWIILAAVTIGAAALIATPDAGSAATEGDSYGLVDPATGIWHLYEGGTEVGYFFFGNPGDYPFMGDWNCNDIDTPGFPANQHPECNHRDPDAPLTISLPQHDQHPRLKVSWLTVVVRSAKKGSFAERLISIIANELAFVHYRSTALLAKLSSEYVDHRMRHPTGAIVLASAAVTRAGDWPGWRGPTSSGTSDEKDLVLKWDGKSGEGIAWKGAPDKGFQGGQGIGPAPDQRLVAGCVGEDCGAAPLRLGELHAVVDHLHLGHQQLEKGIVFGAFPSDLELQAAEVQGPHRGQAFVVGKFKGAGQGKQRPARGRDRHAE